MKKLPLKFYILFRPEPEGGFTALVPSLPGCISYGKDLSEAKRMIVDAMEGYINTLNEYNEEIPNDIDSTIDSYSFLY